ncbi:MAG: cell division protein FtsA, partial [bacterium]|nr:cell division protein FtsA [bacterium]
AGTTSLAVFEEGDVKHLAVLPVGAENITNDLAIGLRCEHEVAERIKTEYGTLLGSKGKRTEKIDLPGGEQLTFTAKFVSHIIEERVKEILDLVQKELKKIEKQGQLPGGVILCGGGAKLPKIAEFARKELKLPVKVGVFQGSSLMEADPSHLTVFGLLVSAAEEEGRGQGTKRKSPAFAFLRRLFKSFIP